MNTRNSTQIINNSLSLVLLLVCGIGITAQAATGEQVVTDDNLLLEAKSVVSRKDLESSRGRQGIDALQQMNENDQRAWLEDNELDSELTGNNIIENGALDGIEGISTVIQNTGNQVVIQESTLLNLTIAP